jgi:AmiR/NasT family two-component response regulator
MPCRVVIADDEFLVAVQLQHLMVSLGYAVVGRAKNGREAVGLCRAERPDLALMDVKMPEMDGLTATRSIVEKCPTCVIIVTGNPHFDEAAAEAGAMGYVVKPAGPGIAAVIDTARKRFGCFQELRDQAGGTDEALRTWGLAWKAVKALMSARGVTEEEACDELRRCKDGAASVQEAAESILSSLSAEGPAPPAQG